MIQKKIKYKYVEVKPTFTKLIVTADKFNEAECTQSGIVLPELLGTIKDMQKVVFMGYSCRDIEIGNLVSLNFDRYKKTYQKKDNTIQDDINEHYKKVFKYELPIITINDVEYLFLDMCDVEYIVKDYEEIVTEVEVNTSSLIQDIPKNLITSSNLIL